MFCQQCGMQIPDGTTACSSCGTVVAGPSPVAVTVHKVKTASKDAWQALKLFAGNPVPGMPAAFETLGQKRALGVGVTFGAVFALCFILAVYRVLPEWSRPFGFIGFLRTLLAAVAPVVTLFGAAVLSRKAFGGAAGFAHDSFTSGASALPFGCVALLAAILGPGNMQVLAPCALFAGCLTVLILFAALTRIAELSERAATVAVPLMLIVTTWASKVIYVALVKGS